MRKFPKKELQYSPLRFPQRHSWEIACNIPRADIPRFCEQLHAIVSERHGASFYYPNSDTNENVCRYEWHLHNKSDKYAIRIGMLIKVGQADLTSFEVFATTAEACKSTDSLDVEFSEQEVQRISRSANEVLAEVDLRLKPESAASQHVVYHVEMPFANGTKREIVSHDNFIRILPTAFTTPSATRVSAICVTVKSASRESAKHVALEQVGLACALLSLATGQHYKLTHPKWQRSRPAIRFLDSAEAIDIPRLYPNRQSNFEIEECDTTIGDRFVWAWEAFQNLSQSNREVFTNCLFAIYAAIEESHRLSTMSVVAYVAALASLAESSREKCPGSLSCSECGALAFNHDLVGDKRAVVSLICEFRNFEEKPQNRKRIKDLMDRVYGGQRSAFVHSAKLRHQEFYQGDGLPAAFPAEKNAFRDLYSFRSDFMSLRTITRDVALLWLSKNSQLPINEKMFSIDRSLARVESGVEAAFTLPSDRVVVINPSKANSK